MGNILSLLNQTEENVYHGIISIKQYLDFIKKGYIDLMGIGYNLIDFSYDKAIKYNNNKKIKAIDNLSVDLYTKDFNDNKFQILDGASRSWIMLFLDDRFMDNKIILRVHTGDNLRIREMFIQE